MSASSLTRAQRHIARDRFTQAALLGLHHRTSLHYSEGIDRWQGIDDKRDARKGQFPRHADCSSFMSWCLWNALYLGFKLDDIVNGEQWRAGYTGTLAQHGRRVVHTQDVIRGDLVLYGKAFPYQHVAGVVGHDNGTPIVVSNGSEPGPFLLHYNYRPDVAEIRRYI